MKLTRKLDKLFGADMLQSAREHLSRLTHPIDTRPMFARLDPAAWADLQRRYRPTGERGEGQRNSFKFADANYWMKVNVERAQDLALDRMPPRRILDLGCGAGFFLFVCQCLGHEVLGLDLDDNPLYRETIGLLGVSRVIGRVEPHVPLPVQDGQFDLITAHCICFQKIARLGDEEWQQWGADEWRFFLHDLRERLLRPGGRILLDFNPRPGGPFYPPDAERLFRAEGARIFRSKVLFAGQDGMATAHPAGSAHAQREPAV